MADISGLLLLASLSRQYFFLLIFKYDLKNYLQYSCNNKLMHENSSSCIESIFNIYFKINFLLSYYP